MISTIRCLLILIINLIAVMAYGQSNLELLQGYWKEEIKGIESYMVVQRHYWFSITVVENEIDISIEWVGFYEDFDVKNLNPRNIASDGRYLVFLAHRNTIENYDSSLPRKYYKFYEYDLDEDYFIYYANQPISLNRLDKLPPIIQKAFDQQIEELRNTKFIGIQE